MYVKVKGTHFTALSNLSGVQRITCMLWIRNHFVMCMPNSELGSANCTNIDYVSPGKIQKTCSSVHPVLKNLNVNFIFLRGCLVYEDIRQKFLYGIREFNRVERLFRVNDTYMIRSIAMFLYYAFKRRREAAEVDFAEM